MLKIGEEVKLKYKMFLFLLIFYVLFVFLVLVVVLMVYNSDIRIVVVIGLLWFIGFIIVYYVKGFYKWS